jgi:pyrimidine-nucleoside phosphorylase
MSDPNYSPVEIISGKQAGRALSTDEIRWFVESAAGDGLPDYQIAALLMAIYFRGMNLRETRDLTEAMIRSGKVLELSSVEGVRVDKHSTGGVGDKISLIVGPLAAAVGVKVPMVSGRGLGHTGGTLDKLESIPGFKTGLSPKQFERTVRDVGISIIGQSDLIAPADRKFYAIRDVTSTIKCQPLIVGSILSKKIASGADAVVFDIKCGKGAFMENLGEAKSLSIKLSKVAAMMGKKVVSVVTRMDEPLGATVGNAIEVKESIQVLKGKHVGDLLDVTFAIGAEMVLLAGKAKTRDEAQTLLRSALLGGKGLEKFRELVEAQGGDARAVDDPERLPGARHRVNVCAARRGYVRGIDALAVGKIATMLGAGRLRKEDSVDHAVGIEFIKKKGGRVTRGDTLAVVHASSRSSGRRCAGLLEEVIEIGPAEPRHRSVVVGRVDAGRIHKIRLPES